MGKIQIEVGNDADISTRDKELPDAASRVHSATGTVDGGPPVTFQGKRLPRRMKHYMITGVVGCGGMGVVYRALDLRLKRITALKFLPPQMSFDKHAKNRFVREARAASRLEHPNICTVHEVGEFGGSLYLAMPCYRGQTLREVLETGPINLPRALEIGRQLASGLRAAHSEGVIHRDLKPGNIFLTSDGTAKILDFGLSKLVDSTSTSGESRDTGSIMGTVAYMSPEQARGEALDHRTDIWSLGIVLYEMLTGQRPFDGDYDQAVIYSILNVDPEPIRSLNPSLPIEVEGILNRMLAKPQVARYDRTQDVVYDLKQLGRRHPTEPAGAMMDEPIGTTTIEIRSNRRLAAIMYAEVVEGTALLLNEDHRLKSLRDVTDLSRKVVVHHGGREIGMNLGSCLVEFTSALQSIRCARQIQRVVRARNRGLAPERQVELRIGIHLGDVVYIDGNPEGDGVRLAKTVHRDAPVGGIAVTEDVSRQLRARPEFQFDPVRIERAAATGLQSTVMRLRMPWEKSNEPDRDPDRDDKSEWPFRRIRTLATSMTSALRGFYIW